MTKSETPRTIHRKDYRPPDYRIGTVVLDVALDEEETRVRSRLEIRAAYDRKAGIQPLTLDGKDLELLSIAIDGVPLAPADYTIDDVSLTLHVPPERFALETEVRIHPETNTKLEGLYKSAGNFCTQCEAEGFRRITWHLDRPDTMAVFTTRITADKARYPVLLSNGNLTDSGDLPNGRHFAEWSDPFPKPSYLFALVAGNLVCAQDRFLTRSGRDVDLRIYVEPGKENRCGFAMESLKKAMRWDEETFGLEYDLDIYMIVAVSDFNMGAMENKGLNVFNDKYVLADPDIATDDDYARIEAIIAHEYFHNWTGNRVTCRDWFQLSLKEGLTVFRDQRFSEDMRSPAVERIKQVRALRARQFPEDAGPLAHPIRPDSYIEINNFYTATVYEKGAEVIGMIHTLLGADGFRKGMDLYIARHDGEAATCEQFVSAMEDANGADLGQFRRWYEQAGTPVLEAEARYDAAERTCDLTVRQSCPPTPGQPDKPAFHIPLAMGLVGANGNDLPLQLDGENAPAGSGTRVLPLAAPAQTFRFVNLPSRPVPSLLRGFSAPVTVKLEMDSADRAHMIRHDADPFNRWEAAQQYATRHILGMVEMLREGGEPSADPHLIDALAATLRDQTLDKDFIAEMLTLPGESYLGQQMAVIDPDAVHDALEAMRRDFAVHCRDALLAAYGDNAAAGPYSPDPESRSRRRLRNVALDNLCALDDDEPAALALAQLRAADNMTDRIGALTALNDRAKPARDEALAEFYDRWKGDPLVVDKWFALQATSALPGTLATIEGLLGHPAFSLRTPNRVRALIGAFCTGNQLRFHSADGAGYRFLADRVLEIDRLNPQVAARLMGAFGQWRRFDERRQSLMHEAVARISGTAGLSRDVYEIASKTLAQN